MVTECFSMAFRVRGRSGADGESGGRRAPGTLRVRTRLAGWACALGLALSLAACDAPVRQPLVVGVNTWVGYDPLVLARDRALVDPLRVKVVEVISSAEALSHLRNGLLDAAALTLDETLRLAESGFDVRIVALLDTSTGADVVLAAPRVTSLQKLRGESIAVEDSTLGMLILERLLRMAGLARGDVTVLQMDATLHKTALLSDRVAAAISYAPIDGPIRELGFRPIFDSRQMPGDIVDVLVVRAEVLSQRPDDVDALLHAWAAGLSALEVDPVGASAQLAPGVDMSPAQYRAVLEGLRFHTPAESLALLGGDPPALAGQSQNMVQLLTQLKLLQRPPRWADLVDASPARRVADEAAP
jgi:NitT/TauT family transport system substrate-binding protein